MDDLTGDLAGLAANTSHSFYFLSDGDPNTGDTSQAITDWQNFVAGNEFESIAVGFGFAPSDSNNYLEDIAGDAALYLQNASDLLDTFTGSVSTGASVEGNVLTDGETTPGVDGTVGVDAEDRKSTRLNSSP